MKPLSFVIITYNRPEDMLALAHNISRALGADEWVEEVISSITGPPSPTSR